MKEQTSTNNGVSFCESCHKEFLYKVDQPSNVKIIFNSISNRTQFYCSDICKNTALLLMESIEPKRIF